MNLKKEINKKGLGRLVVYTFITAFSLAITEALSNMSKKPVYKT